jgi:maltooligosyltrehalose trehalohydrolase
MAFVLTVANSVNTSLQRIGARYDAAGSEFIVWAPLRRQVELIIASSLSVYQMEKEEAGYWKLVISAPPGTRYRYRLDGTTTCPDPASFHQPEGVHGPSEVVNISSFSWTDETWEGLPLSNMIIYETHTGCFSNSHDFEGIIQKLDYLVKLGINTLELMPLGQFPGNRNWGYDGVFPFAIQDSYGGINEFLHLVDSAHAKGIAILVDVVYNHFGPEGNYLEQFGPYFTDKHYTPWGKAVNLDDAWSDGVRNYFLQNARMWLEDYHVDGLRLDAVHAIKDSSARHFMRQLKEEVDEIEKRTGRKKALIAELDLNDPRYINPLEKGGYGLDGQWIDEFHHALHALLTGERNAYYEDFGEIVHLEQTFRHTYVYNGKYSTHRKRTFGAPVDHLPYDQFVVFAQNHDQIGNRAKGDRLTQSLPLEQLKLAAATILLSPYVPLLFMGEEYGEKNPFPFFVSFTEPALVEAVRQGRKAEFPAETADHELPDPQAEETFQQAVLSWDYPNEAGGFHAVLYKFYQQIIAFRRTRPAMQGRARDTMIVHPSKDKLLCFERKIITDHLFIFLNFNGQALSLENLHEQPLRRVLDSSATELSGPTGTLPAAIAPGGTIELPPWSAVVFEIIIK